MKNNKNIDRNLIRPGMRIKMALPNWYCTTYKTRHKKYTWWKGKVKSVQPSGAFTVYLGTFIGNLFVGSNQEYRMVKQLNK